MQFIDYYSVLELPFTTSTIEIKSAYRALVKKYHPDINHSPNATAKMQLLNEAYLILSDAQAKALYDIERKRYFEANQSQARQSSQQSSYQSATHSTQRPNTESESGQGYTFESDTLRDWVEKARQQAKDITAQAVIDAGGIIKEAGNGIANGVGRVIVYFVAINIIFLLAKGCH